MVSWLQAGKHRIRAVLVAMREAACYHLPAPLQQIPAYLPYALPVRM
jgi:hypothetical protein